MLSSKDGLFDKARGRMAGSSEYLTKTFYERRAISGYSEAYSVIQ